MSKIAVFDSGLGGLTVLSELVRLMPEEDYIYYGDSVHAPFGDRSDEELLGLCSDICGRILEEGPVSCFAVACNTTSTRVLPSLSECFPAETFLGIYPAIGEAVSSEPGRNILVLATKATAESAFLREEAEKYANAAAVSILAAPGIVPYVESGGRDRAAFMAYLRELLSGYRETTDAVVLGCTHFPFVRDELRASFSRNVRFYDGALSLAVRTREFLAVRGLLGSGGAKGQISFLNSDPAKLETEEKLFYEYRRD